MIALLRIIVSKTLALAILLALAYGAYTLVIEPLAREQAELADNITAQRSLLGRLQVAGSNGVNSGQRPSSRDAGPVFLDGESDAIRISGLQSKLNEAAQGIGARLSSTQALPPRELQGVRLIGIQTQVSTTLEQLQKFLFELETAQPQLFVETISVSRGPDREGQEVSELDIRLTVLGATQRPKGPL